MCDILCQFKTQESIFRAIIQHKNAQFVSEIDTKKGLLFTGVPIFLELVSNSRFDQIIIIPVFMKKVKTQPLEYPHGAQRRMIWNQKKRYDCRP